MARSTGDSPAGAARYCGPLWLHIVALLWVAASPVAMVRADPAFRLEPVDQAVGDLDDLATSLRRVEVGLRRHGEQTGLYRVDNPPGQRGHHYYRLGAGFRARLSRPAYLVVSDKVTGRPQLTVNASPHREGQFLELVPLGTVWEIASPELAGSPLPRVAPSVGRSSGRRLAMEGMDHRIPAIQYDYRVASDLAPEKPAAPSFLMRQVVRRRPDTGPPLVMQGGRNVGNSAATVERQASSTPRPHRAQEQVVDEPHATDPPRDEGDRGR